MTLRELLDAATPGPWHAGIEEDREAYVFSSAPEFGWVTPRPHDGQEEGCTDDDALLIALAPELAALVLDMGDALDMVRGALRFEEDQAAFDAEILPLLARLDRISTQTERSHAPADRREATAGAVGTPGDAGDCIGRSSALDCIGRSSALVTPGEAPGRSVCVCDPPDQVFSRTLCACGAMHTYCGKCGEQQWVCQGVRVRPRLLDLFCGAGGAAVGYHRAGFDVVGVDIVPQPNYPFQFVRANALQWPVFVDEFDAIHASPPCQAYSLATLYHGRSNARKHPDLVAPTRVRLDSWGLPYVIENVPGSPVRSDVVLCGEMFGLRVHRHRVFELGGWFTMRPPHSRHVLKGAVTNCHVQEGMARLVAGNYANHTDASDAMGIDWMARKELAEAIPPAYTQWIGERLLAHLSTNKEKDLSDAPGCRG